MNLEEAASGCCCKSGGGCIRVDYYFMMIVCTERTFCRERIEVFHHDCQHESPSNQTMNTITYQSLLQMKINAFCK